MSATATGDGYTIVEDAALQGRNTFRVPARAAMLVDVRKPAALAELSGYAMLKSAPLLVLGQGSNILFTRDWPGVVLSIAAHAIEVLAEDGQHARVRVEAGANWNEFVHWSLARGFAGLENLVLIPGTVGAAPIQNIGAYGVEVGEFIAGVEAWDLVESQPARIEGADCGFGYRDSRFKSAPGRHIVTAVEFVLPRAHAPRLDYAGVREELARIGAGEAPRPAEVAEAIARLRMRKLPDPALIGNAGSFYKNPVVPAAVATALQREHPGLPAWPADGHAKLSAAWLIEACGFKGLREGDAGVSDRHALVLVNHGAATGAQLWALARRVRDGVHARFGVELEPEPIVL